MRLSTKLYFGFTLMILFALVQGGVSLRALNISAGQSYDLAEVYVPEMSAGETLNQQTAMAGYHMRAFALSFNPEDYQNGVNVFSRMDEALCNAEKMVEANPVMLAEAGTLLTNFRTTFENYRKISAEISGTSADIVKARETIMKEVKYFEAAINQMRQNFEEDLVYEQKAYEEDFSRETADQFVHRYRRFSTLNAIESDLRERMKYLWLGVATGKSNEAVAEAEKGMAGIVEQTRTLLASIRQEKDLPPARALVASAESFAGHLTVLRTLNESLTAQAAIQVQRFRALLEIAEKTADSGMENTKLAAAKVEHTTQAGVMWQIICILAMLMAAATAAFLLVRAITGPINRIIANLEAGADQISEASGQMSEAAHTLAEGATEQAASLEETSAALEQTASMIRQNADNSTLTVQTTGKTVDLLDDGEKAMANMSQAMNEISDSADKIGNIIKAIEEIAFQTNLLALNAAVEAARAGESGKGFAVVADEVRSLAQRSAQAARDTAELIEGAITRVKNGSKIATTLDSNFAGIDTGMKEVGRLIAEITSATNEQAQGVDQVNTAVAQLDKVTQRNAAAAEECAAVSEELTMQASSVKEVVSELVFLMTGERHHSNGNGHDSYEISGYGNNGNGLRRLSNSGNGNGHGGNGNGNNGHDNNGHGNNGYGGNGSGKRRLVTAASRAGGLGRMPASAAATRQLPLSSRVMKPSEVFSLDGSDFKDF